MPECPFCGHLDCPVTKGGSDITDEGYRIRQRECANCKTRFTTVEAPILLHTGEPAPFRPLAVNLRMKERELARKRQDCKYSKRGQARSAVVTVRTHFQYLAEPEYRPSFCRNGHDLRLEKAWREDSRGRSHCMECRRANARRYKARIRDQRKEQLSDNSRQTELGPSAFAQSGQ